MKVSRRIRRDRVGITTGLFTQFYYDFLLYFLWFGFVITE